MILSKQVLCTETVFSACLAWRSPDHHWQCNWRVAWTSSRMYAGKRRTLRATIVKYSAIWQETCQFLSNATQFLHLFFWKLPVIRTSKFRKVVCGNTLKAWWEVLYEFCWKFTFLSSSLEFWKSVENWQSYRHEFGVLLFWDTAYIYRCVTWLYDIPARLKFHDDSWHRLLVIVQTN